MPNKLSADLLKFTEAVHHLDTPKSVLGALDRITWSDCQAHVLGAALLPLNFGASHSLVTGKTVFLHESVPKGWWEDRTDSATRSPAPSDVAARLALAPFTLTELMKSLEPIGIDRWAVELNLKHGIRDLFGCPIGGRWIFAYWSPKAMNLQPHQRALLFLRCLFRHHPAAKARPAVYRPDRQGCQPDAARTVGAALAIPGPSHC